MLDRVTEPIDLAHRRGPRADPPVGPEGNLAKLWSSRLATTAAELGVELAGAAGRAWDASDEMGRRWARNVCELLVAIGIAGCDRFQYPTVFANRHHHALRVDVRWRPRSEY